MLAIWQILFQTPRGSCRLARYDFLWLFKVFPTCIHMYTNTLLHLCSKQLLKSLWQKEKLLISQYHFLRVSIFFRWFQSRLVQIFCIWERVELYEVVYISSNSMTVMPMIIELNWLVVWSLVDKHIQGLYIIFYLLPTYRLFNLLFVTIRVSVLIWCTALNFYSTLPNDHISSNY